MISQSPPRSIPPSPLEFQGTLETLVDNHLSAVMPAVNSVEHIHQRLVNYCAADAPLLLIRNEKAKDRGAEVVLANGCAIRWTDNSPAWAMHQAAYFNRRWTDAEFGTFIRGLPIKMFDVKGKSINSAKWYVAHIFPVKSDSRSAYALTKSELIARFVRNVHPINHFYFPDRIKGTGRTYGEDPEIIKYLAMRNGQRYASIWTEFLGLALAQNPECNHEVLAKKHVQFRRSEFSAVSATISRESQETIDVRPAPHSEVSSLSLQNLRGKFMDWTGNDENKKCHHAAVRSAVACDLRLNWRISKAHSPMFIGCYRLNLQKLLLGGFVRQDTKAGHVRVRLVHANDDGIYIQANKVSPRHFLGWFKSS